MFGPVKNNPKDVKPLTIREQREADKLAEQKKKINIFLSRRSSEEGSASSGYQTSRSSFAGGEVESRSRVSFVGGSTNSKAASSAVESVRNKIGFAGSTGPAKGGFAKMNNSARGSGLGSGPATPTRPIGFR